MTTPKMIGRYEVKKELGQGGMATVYLAHDPRFERDVALKVLPHAFLHDPAFRQRFEREAKMIAGLEHKAIVPVYDFGEHEGQPYLVMRYMGGGSLLDKLRRGPMPLEASTRIVSRIASALQKAHEAGIVHRDLKPGNILFDQHGDAYLSDFGIAKLLQQTASLTSTGSVIGTPAYMSPEQAKGAQDLDGRSDIYALGAILYEMLTGRLPYQSDTPVGLVMKHIMEPVPRIRDSNPNLPIGVEQVITRSMAKEPDQRYRTSQQMALALDKVDEAVVDDEKTYVVPQVAPMEGTVIVSPAHQAPVATRMKAETAVSSPPPSPTPAPQPAAAPPPQPRRRRWPWLVVGLLLVAGLAVAGLMLLNGGNGLASVTGGQPQTAVTAPQTAVVPNADLPALCGDMPAPTQADVMVRVVNQSGFEGVGFWLDRQSQLVEYFRVADGGSYDQETFAGDKWVVQEPGGGTLQEYTAAPLDRQCVLVKRPLGGSWLTFTNQSGGHAAGYLVAADGTEEAYFHVAAGTTVGLWSGEGNVWRVRDGAGNGLLDYTATAAAEQAVVISR
ncbi:MAG: protein kinase [Ardenticatenaceae bacterium]|nr:protein kinase [Ardenticatenaceae bacterium]